MKVSSDISELFLRVFIGISMLLHGIPKIGILFSGNVSSFLNPIGLGSEMTLSLSILAEVVCSILLIAGVLTRLSACILSLNMIGAIIYLDQTNAPYLGQIELAVLYLGIYISLIISGGGNISIDKMFRPPLVELPKNEQ